MSFTLEICANSCQSALNAQKAGAQRVELCTNLWEAGTTPSYGTIKKARALLNIQLFILIRPRGGDFIYSDLEFELIKEEIDICKKLGVDGIVSGILDRNNNIDIKRTKELVEFVHPLPFTFHRAFDLSPDLMQSLDTLIELQVDRVLTSGGQKSAALAIETISKLNQRANGKIVILPGGGITPETIQQLILTGCNEFHMTGNVLQKSLAKQNALSLNGSTDIPESDYLESSIERIQKVRNQLDAHFK